MTSSTSTQLTFSENDGIKLEIMEPNQIVLPIPENITDAVIPLQIEILMTNNSTLTFPFIEGALTLELLGEDGQVLLPSKFNDNQIDPNFYRGMSIPTRRAIVRCLRGKLFWQNNLLQLETTISGYSTQDIYHQGIFSNLQPGTYQLRLTYSFPKGEFSFFDSSERTTTILEVSQAELLATPWTPLRLIQPVQENQKAVEVDGIRFETIIQEKMIKVPSSEFNVNIPVELGLKITNNTLTPYRFVLFDSLIPELRGEDGLIVRRNIEANFGYHAPVESDFHLAIPGESITLFPGARLVWQTNEILKLFIPGHGWNYWRFENLKAGKYQIQLIYKSQEKYEFYPKDSWIGLVSTPFVEFELTRL